MGLLALLLSACSSSYNGPIETRVYVLTYVDGKDETVIIDCAPKTTVRVRMEGGGYYLLLMANGGEYYHRINGVIRFKRIK